MVSFLFSILLTHFNSYFLVNPAIPANSQQMMHNVLPPPNAYGQTFDPGMMPPFPFRGTISIPGYHGRPPPGPRGPGMFRK